MNLSEEIKLETIRRVGFKLHPWLEKIVTWADRTRRGRLKMAKRKRVAYSHGMRTIELTNTCVCTSQNPQPGEYVLYTGAIAGITDATILESNPEALDRRTDEVELHRD
jgi:hypothetical protein